MLYLYQICTYEFEILYATIIVVIEYKNDIGLSGICGYGSETKLSSGGIIFVVLAVKLAK